MLVIEPDSIAPLTRFDGWLADRGVTARVVRPYAGDPIPKDVEDGLLVLGGSMSSLDDGAYPWLADIRSLLRAADQAGRPSLGICLGAQLMAQAFGGSTAIGEAGLEAGVTRVEWRPEAESDPLFRGLPSPTSAASMHGDAVVTLPPGAIWLGESSPYRYQAFRVGTSSWGVQFHPEVDLARYREWIVAVSAAGASEEDVARLHEGEVAFRAAEATVLAGAEQMAARFAGLVTNRSAA